MRRMSIRPLLYTAELCHLKVFLSEFNMMANNMSLWNCRNCRHHLWRFCKRSLALSVINNTRRPHWLATPLVWRSRLPWATLWWKLYDPPLILSTLNTSDACDGQTDGRTDTAFLAIANLYSPLK